MKEIVFKNYKCLLEERHYASPKDRISLRLIDAEDGCPVATCTVNLPDYPVPANHVLIKDWNENDGMYAALLEQGIIKPMITQVRTGYCMAYLCELKS